MAVKKSPTKKKPTEISTGTGIFGKGKQSLMDMKRRNCNARGGLFNPATGGCSFPKKR